MRRTTHRPMPFKTHAPIIFYVQTHSGGGQTQLAKLRCGTIARKTLRRAALP